MARLVAVGVFCLLHGVGAIGAFHCYEPVTDWMNGGHWVSPAVRVPVVATGVVLAEVLLLIALGPCNRLAAVLFGCQPDTPLQSGSSRLATPVR